MTEMTMGHIPPEMAKPLLDPRFTARHPRFAGVDLPGAVAAEVADDPRKGDWMQTFSGGMFWPLDPRPEEVFIVDIAHALANTCRFGGHCERFYSVAEHSVLASLITPEEDALAALLHDATEAYVPDVVRPLKPYLTGFKEIEERVWCAIAVRFGLPASLPPSVKLADNAMVIAEGDAILKPRPAPWNVPGAAAKVRIRCWTPEEAKLAFLQRFNELMAERV